MSNLALKDDPSRVGPEEDCISPYGMVGKSEVNESERQAAINKLKDPDFVWEGLGPDGIKYPQSIRYQGKLDWQATLRNRHELDDAFGMSLGEMALRYHYGDETAATQAGKFLLDQLLRYAGVE